MSGTCELCGCDALKARASLRKSLAVCDGCNRTLCEECLAEMAVEKGLICESDVEAITNDAGADGFLNECEESMQYLCPECFEDGDSE